MGKTKILCTLGPSTDDYQVILDMIDAGMDGARLNMSHGDHKEHSKRIELVRTAREEKNVPLAIVIDTKGPEIRLRKFYDGRVTLKKGQEFKLACGDEFLGDETRASISYPPLFKKVKFGDTILCNDGLIELRVKRIEHSDIVCEVIAGGKLTDRKSINLPDIYVDMPYLSDQDREDFLFAIEQNVEYVAISFVRTKQDVLDVRKFLDDNGGQDIEIISKIENRQGVDNIDEIIEVSDGIMVARGDMGVEIPFEELPAIQKKLITACSMAGKTVITATQMLESMVTAPRPTRAEISDVANAVYDGTDCTMLSGETATGLNPALVVQTMERITSRAEKSINYEQRFKALDPRINSVTDAISHATCYAAQELNCTAIIAVTCSGKTAKQTSRFRVNMPIIAATPIQKTYNKLSLYWGVTPILTEHQDNSDLLHNHVIECVIKTNNCKHGDIVAVTAGIPVGESGNTNSLRVETI